MGRRGTVATDGQGMLNRVARTVGIALLGLRRPARVGIRLEATPQGILVLTGPPLLEIEAAATPVGIGSPVAEATLAPTLDLGGGDAVDVRADAVADSAPDTTGVFGMERLRAGDAALGQHSAAVHASALLMRLQDDPATVGVVSYEIVRDVYSDLLIDKQWAMRPWQSVSVELRKLTGSRKRYVNGPDRVKVLVFDIPDPIADELAETFEAAPMRRAA